MSSRKPVATAGAVSSATTTPWTPSVTVSSANTSSPKTSAASWACCGTGKKRSSDTMKRTKKQPRATPYYEVGHALQSALDAVVTVGHGRGFVVEGRGRFGSRDRYVITAAHCLPSVPPCHGASLLEDRTYKNLIAPLSDQPSVWCECLFLDPIADIAVLCLPEELSKQAAD